MPEGRGIHAGCVMKIVEQSAELIYPATKEDAIREMKYIELAGRNCYQSQNKITDDSYLRFVKALIKNGHGSPLEFGRVILKLKTSRDVMAELTRHRLCGFAILSQRFVLESKDGDIEFIRPNTYQVELPLGMSDIHDSWFYAMRGCEECYKKAIAEGAKNEDARKVLPNSTATDIVMTCNIREMLHILSLRDSNAAYPEMRTLMKLVRSELTKVFPEIFDE